MYHERDQLFTALEISLVATAPVATRGTKLKPGFYVPSEALHKCTRFLKKYGITARMFFAVTFNEKAAAR